MEEKRTKSIEQVRHDLQELRVKRLYIRSQIERQNEHEVQLRCLMRDKEKNAREIAKCQEWLAKLDIKDRIAEADELEFKYQRAIASLDMTDQIIINSSYLIGTPHFVIGNRLGYSVDGINRRKKLAIEKIARFIEESDEL